MRADRELRITLQCALAVKMTSRILARSWREGIIPLTWHSWTHSGNSAVLGPPTQRGNGHKLKQARCKLGMRKSFKLFAHEEGPAVEEVTQGGCAVSILEGFQGQTG